MFNHPLDDYDFVIHLDPAVLPRYYQNLLADDTIWASKIKYRNVVPKHDDQILSQPKIGFDPAQLFFRDLQVRIAILDKVFIALIDRFSVD